MKERLLVIEDIKPPSDRGIKTTVVRWQGTDDGFCVSTVPYYDRETYETMVFRFEGYDRTGRTVIPRLDFRYGVVPNAYDLCHIDDFPNDVKAATAKHWEIVHELADRIENNQVQP